MMNREKRVASNLMISTFLAVMFLIVPAPAHALIELRVSLIRWINNIPEDAKLTLKLSCPFKTPETEEIDVFEFEGTVGAEENLSDDVLISHDIHLSKLIEGCTVSVRIDGENIYADKNTYTCTQYVPNGHKILIEQVIYSRVFCSHRKIEP